MQNNYVSGRPSLVSVSGRVGPDNVRSMFGVLLRSVSVMVLQNNSKRSRKSRSAPNLQDRTSPKDSV